MSDARDPVAAASASPRNLRTTTFLRTFVQHRLTHFFLIGAILFALAPKPANSRQVRVDPYVLAALHAEEAQKLGKTNLSDEEKRRVEAQAIEDELLYREALRLRIAEGDIIVRQRLVQKLLVLAEDIDGASEPLTDGALAECFSKTQEQWKLPASVEFVHVVGSSRDTLLGLRDQVVAFSTDPTHDRDIPPLGESFATNRRVTATVEDVAHSFGPEFAKAISQLPVRTWSEPIASKYGLHLVRVLEFAQEKPAKLEDVRGKLVVECQQRRREEAVHRYVERLFRDYDVYLGNDRVRNLAPTRRTAPRGEMSREDG
ncbi:MAG TPA: peptidylprolyl isomerase [Polyangium sp.]|nr:peptidylprolyl isomerase [Polyangium sp.]